jgi:hypothetical protein
MELAVSNESAADAYRDNLQNSIGGLHGRLRSGRAISTRLVKTATRSLEC